MKFCWDCRQQKRQEGEELEPRASFPFPWDAGAIRRKPSNAPVNVQAVSPDKKAALNSWVGLLASTAPAACFTSERCTIPSRNLSERCSGFIWPDRASCAHGMGSLREPQQEPASWGRLAAGVNGTVIRVKQILA